MTVECLFKIFEVRSPQERWRRLKEDTTLGIFLGSRGNLVGSNGASITDIYLRDTWLIEHNSAVYSVVKWCASQVIGCVASFSLPAGLYRVIVYCLYKSG